MSAFALLKVVKVVWAVTQALPPLEAASSDSERADCQELIPKAAESLLSIAHSTRKVTAFSEQRASQSRASDKQPENLALPVADESVRSDAPKSNHIYLAEEGSDSPPANRANCNDYDVDPDFQRARTSSRYPWHDGIFARNSGGDNSRGPWGASLYGTSYAQDAIFAHQHPASCEGKRFLQYAVHGFGPGSNLHTIGAALAVAMDDDRILVLPPRAEEPRLVWYDDAWCPGARGWECWLQPVAGCLPTADSDVRRLTYYDGLEQLHVPSIFEPLLHCSGVPNEKHFYWWRSQSVAYLMRFNEKTRSELDAMRQELLFESHGGQVQPLSTVQVQGGGVAMLVRHGDKVGEMDVEPVNSYVEAARGLFSGSQQLPVRWRSNASFSYPSDAFAGRRVFVHSEDGQVMQVFRSLAGESNRDNTTGNSVQSHDADWTVSFIKPDNACQGWCDPQDVVAQMGTRRGLLTYLLSVEESLQQDAFVCPLLSGWCRLIDELRSTVAGKANAPFIDMSGENPKSTRCSNCYLDF